MKIRRERVSAVPAQACSPQRSSRVDRDPPAVGPQRQRNFQLPGSRLPRRLLIKGTCNDRLQVQLAIQRFVCILLKSNRGARYTSETGRPLTLVCLWRTTLRTLIATVPSVSRRRFSSQTIRCLSLRLRPWSDSETRPRTDVQASWGSRREELDLIQP